MVDGTRRRPNGPSLDLVTRFCTSSHTHAAARTRGSAVPAESHPRAPRSGDGGITQDVDPALDLHRSEAADQIASLSSANEGTPTAPRRPTPSSRRTNRSDRYPQTMPPGRRLAAPQIDVADGSVRRRSLPCASRSSSAITNGRRNGADRRQVPSRQRLVSDSVDKPLTSGSPAADAEGQRRFWHWP